jgi:nitronate monooxygenase
MPAPPPDRPAWLARLRLPLIAAPMLRVSGVDLVAAACSAGVVGAFPTANARSVHELDAWLTAITQRLSHAPDPAHVAPWCPNLIMRSPRLADDLACVLRHGPELVITSVGSPTPVLPALHDIGCTVLADVATLAHAHKAIAAGADGLVLLTAGAGGQTGWLNPFAFVRALRGEGYDGLIALAGSMADGVALRAACVLGADLGYAGTRFIATQESLAEAPYKQMLVDAGADDIVLTRAFTGLPTSMLAPSIRQAGLDPARLDETVTPQTAAQMFGGRSHRDGEAPEIGRAHV